MKRVLWPSSTLFEDMGFTYLGLIDGHDLDRLCHVLEWARELHGPVLVHVHTVKGKGYSFAERIRQDPHRTGRGGQPDLRRHRGYGGRYGSLRICEGVSTAFF